jgi:hypothetical protein
MDPVGGGPPLAAVTVTAIESGCAAVILVNEGTAEISGVSLVMVSVTQFEVAGA